eukprot:Colp12_sorted_trinity150504_noHs@26039
MEGAKTAGPKGDFAVGVTIKLTTLFDEVVEGKIFTFDNSSQTLVLEQTVPGKKPTFRLIKRSFIKDFQFIAHATGPASDLPKVDIDKVRERERAALKQAREAASRIGVGVSAEAQAIFDALSKTYNCRWKNDVILVSDFVTLKAPYNVEDCIADMSDRVAAGECERVRKVLVKERERMAATKA